MSVVDPIFLGGLAAADLYLLIQFRRIQARKFRESRMRSALVQAIRLSGSEEPESNGKVIPIHKRRLAS
jgi:hypothetical protein